MHSAPLPPSSSAAFFRRLLAGILLVNLFVVALATLWLSHARQQDLDNAGVATRNLSKVLEQNIAGTVKRIDLALLTMTDEFAVRGADARLLDRLLAQQLSRLPELESLRIADAQGFVRYGPGAAPGVNVADRDYFIAARDATQAGLVISKPVFARISKKWAIVFARRLSRPDGSFAGVVYANLALEHLTRTFSAIDVGTRGAVTLRDGELGIIARYPEPQGAGSTVGNKVVTPTFRGMVDAGLAAGTFTVHAGIDGIERVFSYRKIGDYPLYVIVGLANDETLAGWREEAAWAAALLAIFIFVTLAAARLLFGTWKRQVAAAEALMRQETKFHTLADFTYDWEYWLDADQREILYMTPSCERITGYSPEDFAAESDLLKRIVHPDDRAAMAEHLCGYAEHTEQAIDFRIRRRDGEIRWIAHACRPVYAAGGQFLGRRVSNRDITERKQAEEALQRADERLNEAQQIAQIGSWELDLVANTLAWSDETFRIFEIDPAKFDASYEAFLALIEPEERERVNLAYTAAVKNRLPYDLIHRLLMPDGSVKYVHEHCRTFYDDADGKPLRSFGTVQDVTLRVLTEESIRESEERYRTIADYTYDWEYWQGTQSEFLYISPSCQRVTGYTQADFISNPNLVYDIIHPEDRSVMDAHIADIRHEDEGSLDFRIVRKDGGIRWIAHGCRAVYAKDGRFLGRRASNRDITDRKSVEEQVQQLAYFDTLTGLPNRRLLFDRLDRALTQAKRFGRSLAIMFLDLDNFKKINDTLGHDAGDELLKEVAMRLETCVRSGDTVARQGGDEFIIVLAEIAEPRDAARVAEKIVAVLGGAPVRLAEQELQVTTSIGIAVYPINGDDDVRELLKKADQAMYAAKTAGRNGYRFYADSDAAAERLPP